VRVVPIPAGQPGYGRINIPTGIQPDAPRPGEPFRYIRLRPEQPLPYVPNPNPPRRNPP